MFKENEGQKSIHPEKPPINPDFLPSLFDENGQLIPILVRLEMIRQGLAFVATELGADVAAQSEDRTEDFC